MASVFPGMDLFLENPAIFADFHNSFINYFREFLNDRLPPTYFAATGSRIRLETADRLYGPDVRIQKRKPSKSDGKANGGGVAVLEEGTRPVVIHVPQEELTEVYLDIFAKAGEKNRLATSIELLSPTDKVQGEFGRESFLRKQRELFRLGVNLVEIDFLRGGIHSTQVPLAYAEAQTGGYDYHVCCHVQHAVEDFLVSPIKLKDSLPSIDIPLLKKGEFATVSLQAVFDRTFDASQFDRQIDYRRPVPAPALEVHTRRWLKKTLASNGIAVR